MTDVADDIGVCQRCASDMARSKRAASPTKTLLACSYLGWILSLSDCSKCRGLYESGLVDDDTVSPGLNGRNVVGDTL